MLKRPCRATLTLLIIYCCRLFYELSKFSLGQLARPQLTKFIRSIELLRRNLQNLLGFSNMVHPIEFSFFSLHIFVILCNELVFCSQNIALILLNIWKKRRQKIVFIVIPTFRNFYLIGVDKITVISSHFYRFVGTRCHLCI